MVRFPHCIVAALTVVSLLTLTHRADGASIPSPKQYANLNVKDVRLGQTHVTAEHGVT